MFTALAVALAVYLAYTLIYTQIAGPPKPMTPASQLSANSQPQRSDVPQSQPASRTASQAASLPSTRPSPGFNFTAAPDAGDFWIQSGADGPLRIELSPRGAAVARIQLAAKKHGRYVHRQKLGVDEPYTVLNPIPGAGGPRQSFATSSLHVSIDGNKQSWPLDQLIWRVAEQGTDHARFDTELTDAAGGSPRIRLTKTYRLDPEKPLLEMRIAVENLSERPITDVFVRQGGPQGVVKEHIQYNMRKLLAATRNEDGGISLTKAVQRRSIKGDKLTMLKDAEAARFVWTALSNKYFAVFTRPLASAGHGADFVLAVNAVKGAPDVTDDPGDYLTEMDTVPQDVAPGSRLDYAFEIYAGTKDSKHLQAVNAAYVDPQGLDFAAARSADRRGCCCTFGWLTNLMVGLLEFIHRVVGNYGIAIMILVVIIRSLLHPLTVFQQKSMFRTQAAMGELQPKLKAVKEKFANDKVKQQQETMKIYSEEGVNPMAPLVGMLPMFLQMPILIALWTGLNTDVNLRHAPFDGFWVKDLSAPDALFQFGGAGITIPILGWLPLIGGMFSHISSLNLLPILMGVSMWIQQKYMPKPHMEARKDVAKDGQKKQERNAMGMTPEEQMRQQQMISIMMCFMFPLMFYYMPAGLNLYWMATNIFGIGESIVVRKQLKQEREQREKLGPVVAKPKKKGILSRWMAQMAKQAETLQKRADELGDRPVHTPKRRAKDERKKRK